MPVPQVEGAPRDPCLGAGPTLPASPAPETPVSSHHRHTAGHGVRNKGPSKDAPSLRELDGPPAAPSCRPAFSGREAACLLGTVQLRPRGLANFLPSCQGNSPGSFGAKNHLEHRSVVGSRTTPASQPTASSYFLRPKGRASLSPPLRRGTPSAQPAFCPRGSGPVALGTRGGPGRANNTLAQPWGKLLKIRFSFSQLTVSICSCRALWKGRTPALKPRGRRDSWGCHRPEGGRSDGSDHVRRGSPLPSPRTDSSRQRTPLTAPGDRDRRQ